MTQAALTPEFAAGWREVARKLAEERDVLREALIEIADHEHSTNWTLAKQIARAALDRLAADLNEANSRVEALESGLTPTTTEARIVELEAEIETAKRQADAQFLIEKAVQDRAEKAELALGEALLLANARGDTLRQIANPRWHKAGYARALAVGALADTEEQLAALRVWRWYRQWADCIWQGWMGW